MPKILLAEDDRDVSGILIQILQLSGYEVQHAANGVEALEMLKAFHPDLVVTDVMMPQMDGWELCRRVKLDSTHKGVPVLILTAKSDSIAELRSFESGADEFLAKPFESTELLAVIQKLVASRVQS
jgi:DNA-binding response OmpR family regulator